MSDAREKAVERLAVMLMNGMPQTLIDGDPVEDDLQRTFMDSQASTWKQNGGYALERWSAQVTSARRVLSLLGLVAIDPALVEAVEKADHGLYGGTESEYDIARHALADSILAQLRR